MGSGDVLIAKYDSSGLLQWNTNWGGSESDVALDIVLDDSGNIYITGMTMSFGPVGQNLFIAKYDSYGLLQWNTIWGGSADDRGTDIVLNGSDIFVTGYTKSFGAGNRDAIIAKFNSTGHLKMNITWGGSDLDDGLGIALDETGNIYISGPTKSFGAGDYDGFIAKFNSTLDSKYNFTWDAGNDDIATGLALDGSGNFYILGYTTSFGPGDADVFIAKLNSTWDSKWNVTWGNAGGDNGQDISLDTLGNIYITGWTNTSGTLDRDAFLAKYNSAGNSLLNLTWGGTNEELGYGIALDHAGNICITGGTESFGAGDYDAFIVKYKPFRPIGFPTPDDEDDDDDADTSAMVRYISIIILASIGAGVAIIYILIKKGVITSTKSKR